MGKIRQHVRSTLLHQTTILVVVAITCQLCNVIHAQGDDNNVFLQKVVPCNATTINISGYTTIEDMNNDMRVELEQIRNGRPSQEPYTFILCPNTVFDLSQQSLVPLLSGSIFTCGLMGDLTDSCVFNGGENQIIINKSNVTNYNLLSINFMGITHTNFTNSVISGTASSITTVTISQTAYMNFDCDSVIRQVTTSAENITAPFKVQVTNATFSNANGNTIFLNLGGELSIEDVRVRDSTLNSFVITGSSNDTEGSAFIRRAIVAESAILDVFVTVQAADIDGVDIVVQEMNNIATVFDVVGNGSTAILENVVIRNNDISQTNPEQLWIGINVRDNAIGTLFNGRFAANTNIRHLISAFDTATFGIQNSIVVGAIGGRIVNERDISALIFSNVESIVTVTNLVVNDTESFTAIYFANAGSNLVITNTCFGEGNNQGTVYISEESNFTANFNFINPGFISSVCGEPGMRLIQERVGSGCFDENRTDCEFDCTTFFDVDTCQAIVETANPTVAPQPTFQPTLMSKTPAMSPSVSTNTPVALPPIFTKTYTPTSKNAPTKRPNGMPTPVVPPTLRPIVPVPTDLETILPTPSNPPSPIVVPSTLKPSCDCHRGKGMKSMKMKGKGMKSMKMKGKGMGMGKGNDSSKKMGKGNGKGDDIGKGKGKGKAKRKGSTFAKGKGQGNDISSSKSPSSTDDDNNNSNDLWDNYFQDDDKYDRRRRKLSMSNNDDNSIDDDDDDECTCSENVTGKGMGGNPGDSSKGQHDIEMESIRNYFSDTVVQSKVDYHIQQLLGDR